MTAASLSSLLHGEILSSGRLPTHFPLPNPSPTGVLVPSQEWAERGGDVRAMVIEEDVERWFQVRAQADIDANAGRFGGSQGPSSTPSSTAALQALDSGSMGGFFPPADLYEYLANLTRVYPDAAGPMFAVGCSLQGRVMYGIRISTMPASPGFPFPTLPATAGVVDPGWGCSSKLTFSPLTTAPDGRVRVSLTGLIHAREPMSAQNLLYFATALLERKAQPDVAYLLSTREIILIPVLNPDGYAANAAANPRGGGMKRKNARPTSGVSTDGRVYPCGIGSSGVDLNRNFAFKWGYDDIGSDSNPCGSQYRGPAAFSEPETQAYRSFMTLAKPILNLNYHSFLDMLLYPYGYATGVYAEGEDRVLFAEYAAEMTRYNKYATGTGWGIQGLYPTNGEADDWTYGEMRIRSMTCEIGSDHDGFWPAPSRILPLGAEAYYQNYALVARAGPVLNATAVTLRVNPDGAAELSFFVTNTGLVEAPQGFTVEVVSASGLTAKGKWTGAYPIKARSTDPLAATIPVVLSAPASAVNQSAVVVEGTLRFNLTGFLMDTAFQGRASLCPMACGDKARCDLLTASCVCFAGWEGVGCNEPVMPPFSMPRPSSTKASSATTLAFSAALIAGGVVVLF